MTVLFAAPKTVDSIGEIKVVASVTNTGSESVKVLKYGNILDADSPTKSFTVSKNGVDAAFKGVKLQLSLDHLDDSAFVTIHSGETVTVTHDGKLFLALEMCALPTFIASLRALRL
jgi:deuterolysin